MHRFLHDNETSAGRTNNTLNVIKFVSHCMLRNRICQTGQSEICFKRRRLIKEEMFLSSVFIVLLYSTCTLSITDQAQHIFSETYSINLINCPNDKKCTFVEHCPAILNLMNHNLLPIHR